ncbi:mucin-3A-like isoform X4 [Xyrauchen texanus]|uniref:mucin-3A-like isoform X2 n=1 Tax=Xyrauchen texanus TaxID=154827 RepID=UPI00224288A1|nr:mucin-3A-like isoform X2 [Xyrauchen texanus]XP_052005052.1 mucin-3A-like isoform X3 [Xyrauchen texanus]XP_052005053.1 mucin-3A-like isoform X4 [Xyrauchen texanus]
MSFTRRSYGQVQTVSTGNSSSTKVVEDSKKKTSLLKDNSWIKTSVNENEPEQDAIFGKTVLKRYKSNENLIRPADSKTSKTESKTTTITTSSGSVHALTKRFGSQDMLNESRTTGTKTTVKTLPKTSTTATTLKDGTKITETTVTTTSKDVVKSRSAMFSERDQPVLKRSSGDYKTEVVTVKSSKDTIDGPTAPAKTTTSIKTYTKEDVSPAKTTSHSILSTKSDKTEVVTVKSSKETTDIASSPLKTTTSIKTYTNKEEFSPTKTTSYSVRSTKSTDDQLFDTLIPTSIQTIYSKPESSDYKTEVVTVKSSKETIDVPSTPVKTTTSIKTYKEEVSPTKMTSYSIQSTKSTEDQLFDTLIPTSIKTTSTNYDSSRGEDITVSKSIRTVYSTSDRNEWTSVTSPTYTRTSYTDSPFDILTSKSTTTVYTSPEKKVNERDLCTFCHKNMYNAEKMILEDMSINCHASCFKCEVCNASLGHLKAGDSLWVYNRSVHCESCFGVTKGKWHR